MKKPCYRCGESKPIDEFYATATMPDGHFNKCKPCYRSDVRANRLAKVDYYRAYDVSRAGRPHRVAQRARFLQFQRATEPRKIRARAAVDRAVAAGSLSRMPCRDCGRKDSHGHHPDYSKPLDVIWLCPVCHSAEHRRISSK